MSHPVIVHGTPKNAVRELLRLLRGERGTWTFVATPGDAAWPEATVVNPDTEYAMFDEPDPEAVPFVDEDLAPAVDVQETSADPEPAIPVRENPEIKLLRPPTSGPGSGVDAWQAYAALAAGTEGFDWSSMNRTDIIEVLTARGVLD